MRYVKARHLDAQKELAYRIYITDSLFYQSEEKRLTKRFYDIINPVPIDKRSGDEIALDVIERLSLKVE